MPRPEAFRTVAKIMDKYSFNSKDIIFMPSGGRFLSKYYSSQKGKMIPFFFYDAFMLNNKQHLKAIFDNQLADNLNRQNARDNLRFYIGSSNINKTFKDYFKANILDKLDNDRYFVFIITRGIAFLDKDTLKTITDYDEYYKDKSLFFMLSSKITNDTLEMSYKYLKPVVVERSGVWEIYIFKK
jgi:hypothetical protein